MLYKLSWTRVLVLLAILIIILLYLFHVLKNRCSNENGKTPLLTNTADVQKLRLHPSVNIVDTESPDTDPNVQTIGCITAKLADYNVPICTYTAQEDKYVSATLLRGAYFEKMYVLKIMECMQRTGFQFVDIGANIGIYTLPVAQMKRNVLAVEANVETIRRLKKSIHLGDVSQYVTLLHNAISDGHEALSLGTNLANRGDTYLLQSASCTEADPKRCVSSTVQTITLDDLIPLLTSNRVIMKVDIQGAEIKVFNPITASKFFAAIHVPFILMEWFDYRENYYNDPGKRAMVEEWLKFFYNRNYTVHHQKTGAVLGKDWSKWSYNVILKKSYQNVTNC